MKKLFFWSLFTMSLHAIPIPAFGLDTSDTCLLQQPALSENHIAFVYANDLWIADRDGKHPRRLTSDDGVESLPVFSPDGQHVAFTAQYDGNTDVFITSIHGGIPTRLTYHPRADLVRGFTPDGKKVLFSTSRNLFTGRFQKLYTVSPQGGMPQDLGLPNGVHASFSPDGKSLAYTPNREVFNQWKNYRGGTHGVIWIFNFDTKQTKVIPQPEGRCNDADPVWMGDRVYFRSDRDGEFNIYAYNTKTEAVEALTQFADFPVLDLSGGPQDIIFEQAGYLHLLNPATKAVSKLTIGVSADLEAVRPRYAKGFRYLNNAAISPSGARAALEFRGEIVTVPAEKGDPRNLTQSTAAHDRSPVWSYDGGTIAFFSDASGEYQIHLAPADGKGETRALDPGGNGFYFDPHFSPDDKYLSYRDNAQALYVIELASGKVTKVAQEKEYSPLVTMTHHWSPDSRYLAYTTKDNGLIQTVYVFDTTTGQSHQITDGLSEVSYPVFDASGKYLYFLASTNAGPLTTWFAQSNADMLMTASVYMAVLADDEPSPLAPESDEEVAQKADSSEKDSKKAKKEGKKEEKAEKDAGPQTRIDFEGLNQRIIALPIPEGNLHNLRAGAEGSIYYIRSSGTNTGFAAFGGPGVLEHFSLKSRKTQTIFENTGGFEVASKGEKLILFAQNSLHIIGANAPAKGGEGRLDLNAVEVRIDPRAEWPQIYDEAWRINRDYFYATNYHGVDWEAMRAKYKRFIPHAAVRSDVNRIIQWLCSELSVGHHRGGGGDSISNPDRVPGGLLGADYDEHNGKYRFKKVYGGLNWNPDLTSPLTQPGVSVKSGEYLLAVNGKALSPPENLYARFENTSGKSIEITVGPNADGSNARTVSVTPIQVERGLRNRDWVEGNIAKVNKATNGRVAYVYVPNTAGPGHTYFKRYFFPQAHKDAIIVDERFNGGGQIADYYIDHLRRPFTAMWATRYGDDLATPKGAIQGPKVMLIDENAGSGGDLLPWMFRKFGLGKLIGKRTWGGLVGILGFPSLMDGGSITAPNLAIWTEDGWIVENQGVPPDIEVEQWPGEVMAGHDPQLEKAIEVILKELEANPPKKLKRPPFPVRNQ